MRIPVLVLLGSMVLVTGCRSADDRVQRHPSQAYEARAANHGPGYTTVATRSVDRARVSGNVVILTQGVELVYVQDAAFYQVPVTEARQREADREAVTARLDRIEGMLAPASEPETAVEATVEEGK
jgi:hypothetical protein